MIFIILTLMNIKRFVRQSHLAESLGSTVGFCNSSIWDKVCTQFVNMQVKVVVRFMAPTEWKLGLGEDWMGSIKHAPKGIFKEIKIECLMSLSLCIL